DKPASQYIYWSGGCFYAYLTAKVRILNISRVHYNTKYHMPQYEAGTRLKMLKKSWNKQENEL
ncbi:hypothetical protein, partial [Diplocloster agilis]|uniref:hypothetical protein n=1 Tax=Diplocloster agilis TaxID=2850323 RepID=UPI00226592A0